MCNYHFSHSLHYRLQNKKSFINKKHWLPVMKLEFLNNCQNEKKKC